MKMLSTKHIGCDEMKNNTRLIAIMIMITMLTALLPSSLKSAETIYAGMSNGDTIIKNASFTDIARSAYADDILRMAAYSIINEYGSTKYYPNNFAAREDVIAALVRAIGKQDAAVTAGDALKKQNPKLTTVDSYKKGHIEVAKTSGIITQAEIDKLAQLTKAEKTAVDKEVAAAVKKNWKMTLSEKALLQRALLQQRSYDKALKNAATREQIAVWTAKALGLQPVVGEKNMGVYGYRDWKSIAPENLPYVEALHRSGILKGETTSAYNPKGRLRRGDMAAMLARAADSTMPALELTTGFGKVVSKDVSQSIKAYEQVTTTDIKIENPDTEIINMTAQSKIAGTKRENLSIPVIKNKKIGNESLIQKNDIVEYTLTKDNKVLLLQVGKYKELNGRFVGYGPAQGLVYMKDSNGKTYQFKLLPNTVVTAQKVAVNIADVNTDMPAKAIYDGSNLRALDLDIEADRINNQDMAVKILFADPMGKVLKVEDEDYNRKYLQLSEDADIYINDQLQGIEAIGFDQDAVLKVADNRVVEIRVYTDDSFEEQPYTQVFTGKVREVVGNNLFVTPDSAPDTQNSYILGSNVPIIKEKQSVNKYKLKPGDRVKLYVDSNMGDYVSRVEVQGSGVKIQNLYKGDIKDVNPSTGEVILSNVYTYGYYDWVKQGDYLKYKVASDAALYNGDSQIPFNKLKDNIGKTIYAVSKSNYGDEEIVHGLLKDGTEDSVYKKIDDIVYTANQLVLNDGRILDYTKGSIIIKDGRLLDVGDLKENTSAFVLQNRTASGAKTAPIISMDSFNGIGGYTISKGYLNAMGEDFFTIESAFKMANNNWESYTGLTYQLSDDTHIYDNIFQNQVITADKFAESRFKPYTYLWPNYSTSNGGKEFHENDVYHKDYNRYRYSSLQHEHSILYTVTDEYGNAVGINIFAKDKDEYKPNKTHDERITSGQVKSVDSTNNVLTIDKVMEFSPIYQAWRPVTVSVPFDTAGTLVLKDGKPASLDDLTVEDRIYAISLDGRAVLILAE